MINRMADAFARLENEDYKVTHVCMSWESYEWLLLWRPEFDDYIWGAEVVITDYKDGRVHLEGRFTGSFGPYRKTTHFHLPQSYSETSR